MLFVGSVPQECVEQALRVVHIDKVRDAFVCCSGSYRFEQALSRYHPSVRIHSNDVSLLSCALGKAATGETLPVKFRDKLSFIEDAIGPERDVWTNLAAVVVAARMCHFRGSSTFAKAHIEHYRRNIFTYLAKARELVEPYVRELRVESFYGGDFRDHAEHAKDCGGFVFAFPPTYAGGYERFYRLVDENTDWTPPTYRLFEPEQLPEWLEELDKAETQYLVYADQKIPNREASAYFKTGRRKGVFLFASTPRGSSVRVKAWLFQPFRYEPVDPSALTRETKVTIQPVINQPMTFLKNKYLMRGLEHARGDMQCLVYLDGKLAGGFVYEKNRGPLGKGLSRINRYTCTMLLGDFAIRRERKLSKLIAMLATGEESIRAWDRKVMQRTEIILTAVFTDKPVSMKYRGIFEPGSRKPGLINYISEVRSESNQAIYEQWFDRYAGNPSRANEGRRAKGARVKRERALHEAGPIPATGG